MTSHKKARHQSTHKKICHYRNFTPMSLNNLYLVSNSIFISCKRGWVFTHLWPSQTRKHNWKEAVLDVQACSLISLIFKTPSKPQPACPAGWLPAWLADGRARACALFLLAAYTCESVSMRIVQPSELSAQQSQLMAISLYVLLIFISN